DAAARVGDGRRLRTAVPGEAGDVVGGVLLLRDAPVGAVGVLYLGVAQGVDDVRQSVAAVVGVAGRLAPQVGDRGEQVAGVAVVDVAAVGQRHLGEQRAAVRERRLAAGGVGDGAEVGAGVGEGEALVVAVFERGQLAGRVEGVGELVVAHERVGGAGQGEGGECAGGTDEAAVGLLGVVDLLAVLGVH